MENKPGDEEDKVKQDKELTELEIELFKEVLEECDCAACEQLLTKGADVNARDEDGCTPLLWAVMSEKKDVVELLLAKGADVNIRNNEDESILHWAAATGNIEITELLLSKGADVNAKDKFGATPLRAAVLNDDPDMAELLRKHDGKE